MAMKITARQIANGAISNVHVNASAAIATSKLALNGTIILKDGTVAFTGAQSMGGFKLTSLGAPTAGTSDAARILDVENAIASLSTMFTNKGSARAGTTANISLTAPGATHDGVTLTNSGVDILWVRAQTAPAENGLYLWNGAASTATRISTMNAWDEFPGALFVVAEGTTYADTIWICTNNTGGTLGTTAVTFQQVGVAAGYSASNFVENEVPSGTVNGSNVTFGLTAAPSPTTSLKVYINGLRQKQGGGEDYTLSGSTITMIVAPETGDLIICDFRVA